MAILKFNRCEVLYALFGVNRNSYGGWAGYFHECVINFDTKLHTVYKWTCLLTKRRKQSKPQKLPLGFHENVQHKIVLLHNDSFHQRHHCLPCSQHRLQQTCKNLFVFCSEHRLRWLDFFSLVSIPKTLKSSFA